MSVIVLSQRATVGGPASQLAYSAWNEAENVLVDSGAARLGLLDRHRKTYQVRTRRVVGRALRRAAGPGRMVPALSSGMLGEPEQGDHLVLMAHGAWELALVERLRHLRRRAKSISVWMPEVWPSELDDRVRYEGYDLVDHIFVGIREVVDQFRTIAPNATVTCVPPAADVVTFGGPRLDPQRNIAVLGIGRREPNQHRRILEWAAAKDELYLYDTLNGQAASWREHRLAVATWYRQARMAVCNYGKHDHPEEIGDLRIIPGRLFEGLAGGAVLIGMPPDEENQRLLVGEVVVESTDTTDLVTLLDKYNDPAVGRHRRLMNAALAAERHDWAHRWRDILSVMGVAHSEGLENRIDQLAERSRDLRNLASSSD